MNEKKYETKEKYLKLLNELFIALKYTSKFSMNAFCIDNNISKSIPKVLASGGVIKNTGGVAGSANWIWISKKPDMKMVDELVYRLSKETSQDYRDARKNNGGPRKGAGRKTKKEELESVLKKQIINIDFSLLWGLIRFSKTK